MLYGRLFWQNGRCWACCETQCLSSLQISNRTLRRKSKSINPTRSLSDSSHGSNNQGSKPKRIKARYVVTIVAGAAYATYVYARTDQSPASLNTESFAPFELISKEKISSSSSIFTLQPKASGDSAERYLDAWKKGVWSVQFKQPQLQIARAYTPLPPASNSEGSVARTDDSLRFLIRRDPFGEVSGYLHALPMGAIVDVRGPHMEYMLPSEVDEVLFLAGGTGIAPALQVAHSLLEVRQTERSPKVRILWANRHRGDCKGGLSDDELAPSSWYSRLRISLFGETKVHSAEQETGPIVEELNALKSRHPGCLSVDYFVDEEGSFIGKKDISRSLTGNLPVVEGQSTTPKGRRLIIVSGPDGFVSYFAGPKIWVNGQEGQGQLGGLLSQIELGDLKVWKL